MERIDWIALVCLCLAVLIGWNNHWNPVQWVLLGYGIGFIGRGLYEWSIRRSIGLG
jgi:hypothetical protein